MQPYDFPRWTHQLQGNEGTGRGREGEEKRASHLPLGDWTCYVHTLSFPPSSEHPCPGSAFITQVSCLGHTFLSAVTVSLGHLALYFSVRAG